MISNDIKPLETTKEKKKLSYYTHLHQPQTHPQHNIKKWVKATQESQRCEIQSKRI